MVKDINSDLGEVKFDNVGPNLKRVEIQEFEEVNDIQLPEDYKIFLLTYNGGKPSRQIVKSPPTIVSYVLGMHYGPLDYSLNKHIDLFNKRIPLDTFPIAIDPFGNLFIMSINPNNYGNIYFWDHEGESDNQFRQNEENCRWVANSFSEFVSGLLPNE